jgi:hypothetical protein
LPLPKKYFNKIVKFIKGEKWDHLDILSILGINF